MPYVPEVSRNLYDDWIKKLPSPPTAGELNYLLTKIVLKWLKTRSCNGEPHYEDFNRAVGVLECVKQELYRRAVAPYEDKKCEENSDVY